MADETTTTETTQDQVKIEDPKAVLDALDRAKSDAKTFREQKEALEAKVAELTSAENPFREKFIKAEAKARLAESGIKGSDRILKLLDVSDLSDDLEGLDDRIAGLKNEFPELFDVKRRVGGAADSFTTGESAPADPLRTAVMRALKKK